MPMSGDGMRFKKSSLSVPKPLIKINNLEMFLKASKTFGTNHTWVFIIRLNKHKNRYIKLIKEKIKKYKIIFLKKKTKGQADTIFKASKFIKNKLTQIYINSCDLYFKFSLKELNLKLRSNDLIVFIAKPNKINLKKFNNFGWVKIKDNKIIKSACKKKVSTKPKYDWIIIGSFVFKNKIIFDKILKKIFNLNIRINNEFYLDTSIQVALDLGLNVNYIKVKKYQSWGTPMELMKFNKKK